jgi:hypothetical protein
MVELVVANLLEQVQSTTHYMPTRRLASIHAADIPPKPNSHSRLLNLTGFFSSFGGAAGKPATVPASAISESSCRLGAGPRQKGASFAEERITGGISDWGRMSGKPNAWEKKKGEQSRGKGTT